MRRQQQQQQQQQQPDGPPSAASRQQPQQQAPAASEPAAVVDNSPDRWEVNKPVERRSELLTEELNDCFGRFWTWVTCGGPTARMRQLYINGKLSRLVRWGCESVCGAWSVRAAAAGGGRSCCARARHIAATHAFPTDQAQHATRCWDEYTRFKNCLVGKLNPDAQLAVLPGPHPLWHIRTRKEAGAFWRQHFAHLGAGATTGGGGGSSSSSSSSAREGGGQQQQQQAHGPPPLGEAPLRFDVTTKG
jgi:hypothetical protein